MHNENNRSPKNLNNPEVADLKRAGGELVRSE